MSIYVISEGAEKSLGQHTILKLADLKMCMDSEGFCVAGSTFITVISSIGAEIVFSPGAVYVDILHLTTCTAS